MQPISPIDEADAEISEIWDDLSETSDEKLERETYEWLKKLEEADKVPEERRISSGSVRVSPKSSIVKSVKGKEKAREVETEKEEMRLSKRRKLAGRLEPLRSVTNLNLASVYSRTPSPIKRILPCPTSSYQIYEDPPQAIASTSKLPNHSLFTSFSPLTVVALPAPTPYPAPRSSPTSLFPSSVSSSSSARSLLNSPVRPLLERSLPSEQTTPPTSSSPLQVFSPPTIAKLVLIYDHGDDSSIKNIDYPIPLTPKSTSPSLNLELQPTSPCPIPAVPSQHTNFGQQLSCTSKFMASPLNLSAHVIPRSFVHTPSYPYRWSFLPTEPPTDYSIPDIPSYCSTRFYHDGLHVLTAAGWYGSPRPLEQLEVGYIICVHAKRAKNLRNLLVQRFGVSSMGSASVRKNIWILSLEGYLAPLA